MSYPQQEVEHFHFGHVGVIALVAVLLLGMSWMKNPELFSALKNRQQAGARDVPRYYAYEPPLTQALPAVAGASTEDGEGISVLNEDGSISKLDIGEVLGASTELVNSELMSVEARLVPDSNEAVSEYSARSLEIEASYMDNVLLEQALASGDQGQMNRVAEKISSIIEATEQLSVPVSLEKLHRLKLLQYQAASTLLKNYSNAETTPEALSESLGVFLKTQQMLAAETQSLTQKFPDYALGN